MTNEELDQARAEEAFERSKTGDLFTSIAACAARLAREGWTPPVDPDLAEAAKLYRDWEDDDIDGVKDIALAGIKRGRALAAEVKPGLVWVKHDGENHCPVDPDSYVWIKRWAPLSVQTAILMAGAVGWHNVTHYAVITPPAEDVA